MRIRDVIRKKGTEVHAVQASERIADVLTRYSDSKIRCLAVTEGESLRGLLTLRDVVAHIDRRGEAGLDDAVELAMTRDVMSIPPDASADEAEALFAEHRINHLPVVEDGVLVALVTPADVLSRHLEDAQVTSKLMHDYCSGVFY